MMNLIPMPKMLRQEKGFFLYKHVHVSTEGLDSRIVNALSKLPLSIDGARMTLKINGVKGEDYTLKITEDRIVLAAEGIEGAFYGIQTLRQIFTHDKIPCLYIEDRPDFSYRGFYQDITRGRVPKLEWLKQLVDQMAYYKLNSLQLYVEHTFAFHEFADSIEDTGYLSAEEIRELDEYCYENFIELIPSMATFGHLYELLEKPKYKELCMLEDYEPEHHYWIGRTRHHTIDPANPKSFALIQSMIDQYLPLFCSDKFNICGDETFDLSAGRHEGEDTARLYVDFVKQIVEYVQSKGRKIMMWADILLKYPETIEELPENIQYLNWYYDLEVKESDMEVFERLQRPQIVCPGSNSWASLCPNLSKAELNICRMTELGYKHGAVGVLNTVWGDCGHPCSNQLTMYSMVAGAEKSWSVHTKLDDSFTCNVNKLLFHNEHALEMLRWLSLLNEPASYLALCSHYSNLVSREPLEIPFPSEEMVYRTQRACMDYMGLLAREKWELDFYREEMLVTAEGIAVIIELMAKVAGYTIQRYTDTKEWLKKYRKRWLADNKESELREIENMFLCVEENLK